MHYYRCSSERAYIQPTQALLLRQLREHQVVPQDDDRTDKIFGAVGMPDVTADKSHLPQHVLRGMAVALVVVGAALCCMLQHLLQLQGRSAAIMVFPPPCHHALLTPSTSLTFPASPDAFQAWLDDRYALAGSKCGVLLHVDTHTSSCRKLQQPAPTLPPRQYELGGAHGIQDIQLDPSCAHVAVAGSGDGRVGASRALQPYWCTG